MTILPFYSETITRRSFVFFIYQFFISIFIFIAFHCFTSIRSTVFSLCALECLLYCHILFTFRQRKDAGAEKSSWHSLNYIYIYIFTTSIFFSISNWQWLQWQSTFYQRKKKRNVFFFDFKIIFFIFLFVVLIVYAFILSIDVNLIFPSLL